MAASGIRLTAAATAAATAAQALVAGGEEGEGRKRAGSQLKHSSILGFGNCSFGIPNGFRLVHWPQKVYALVYIIQIYIAKTLVYINNMQALSCCWSVSVSAGVHD